MPHVYKPVNYLICDCTGNKIYFTRNNFLKHYVEIDTNVRKLSEIFQFKQHNYLKSFID